MRLRMKVTRSVTYESRVAVWLRDMFAHLRFTYSMPVGVLRARAFRALLAYVRATRGIIVEGAARSDSFVEILRSKLRHVTDMGTLDEGIMCYFEDVIARL